MVSPELRAEPITDNGNKDDAQDFPPLEKSRIKRPHPPSSESTITSQEKKTGINTKLEKKN